MNRPSTTRLTGRPAGERGIALVAVLVFLLVLSVVAAGLLVSVNTETKTVSYAMRSDQALRFAEAGIAEAMERIREGDVPDTLNPKMVTLIFLAEPGDIPAITGGDTTALATSQPSGNRLAYSSAKLTNKLLKVQFKTDGSRTKIYKYNPALNPPVQFTSGTPVYVITSTGQVGDAVRTVVTEVAPIPRATTLKGAIVSAGKSTKLKNIHVCGYDHVLETPTWTDVPLGRNGDANSCNVNLLSQKWETGSGTQTGVWAVNRIKLDGVYGTYGLPSPTLPYQPAASFYGGPWDVYGMTQSEFFDVMGRGLKKKKNNSVGSGILYYPKDAEFKGGSGQGLLYVGHDLKVKGEFAFRGLIYVGHDLKIDGRFWVLGGLVGVHKVDVKGQSKKMGAVLYSSAAISRALEMASGQFVRLSWREL